MRPSTSARHNCLEPLLGASRENTSCEASICWTIPSHMCASAIRACFASGVFASAACSRALISDTSPYERV